MLSLSRCRAALALLLFAGGVAASQALQLGETQAQIVARHGAPAVEDHGRQLAMYYWTGWSARLEFRARVVEKLIYKKNDYLTPADIASLLQANGGANRWRENTPQGSETRQWSRDDGAAASCDAAHATGMTFQSAQAVIFTLQNLAEPKTTAPPATQPAITRPAPAPAPAPQFFPDPQAAKPDPKLSEISAPAATPEPAKAPPVKVAAPAVIAAVEPAPIQSKQMPVRSVENPAPKADLPASIDPPEQTEPVVAPASSASEPAPETSAHPAAEQDGLGRILALGCIIFGVGGALILLFKSLPGRSRKTSGGAVSQPSRGAGLDSLRWEQVELLVAEIHRRIGYTAELSGGLGSDDDIDLTLRRDNETVMVQCRHWKTLRVAEREMREFYGAMASSAAPRGIFVTMGGVTRGARDFAEDKGIEVIDRKTLEERIADISHPGENLCAISEWLEEFASHSRIFDPECPICREAMTLRHHPAGKTASWGCRSYPRCPGKREPRRDLLDLISARQKATIAPAA